MLNIHDLIRLTKPANAEATWRTIAFDGKVAISMANGFGSKAWWAGVPFTQAAVPEVVAVPVDAIAAHLLKSRHLFVSKDHIHNNQGLRTEWKNTPHSWSMALDAMPPRPDGLPVQFELELDALDRVLVAVDENERRRELNGVLLDFETGLLAGTDGARVHMYTNKVPKLSRSKDQGALQIILPKAPAHWLLKSDDKTVKVSVWRLGAEKSLVLMQTTEALVYTVAIDAKFPDVMRVMPQRSIKTGIVRLDPVVFSDSLDAMRKVAKLQSDKKSSVVTVHWGGDKVYALTGPDFKAVNFERLGFTPEAVRNLYASYNAGFLIDAADCVTPTANWMVPTEKQFDKAGNKQKLTTGKQSLAVFDGDFVAVVMPIVAQLDSPPDQPPQVKNPAKVSKAAKSPKVPKLIAQPAEPGPSPAEPVKSPEIEPKPATADPKPVKKPLVEGKPPKSPQKPVKPTLQEPASQPDKPADLPPPSLPESPTVH